MKDWKKELKERTNVFLDNSELDIDHPNYGDGPIYGKPYLTFDETLSFIESLLSKQEEEHKKQMREAIEEALVQGYGLSDVKLGRVEMKQKMSMLFKKYNCEDTKDAE
jgi:hypothetical protein